jgi:hypothetical protein
MQEKHQKRDKIIFIINQLKIYVIAHCFNIWKIAAKLQSLINQSENIFSIQLTSIDFNWLQLTKALSFQ